MNEKRGFIMFTFIIVECTKKGKVKKHGEC